MDDFINECGNTISKVQELLSNNTEWIQRYADYAGLLKARMEKIENDKNNFNEWKPLYLYMNVKEAKSSGKFTLRYLGQDVAMLKVDKDNKVMISTKDGKFEEINKKYFDCEFKLGTNSKKYIEWRSKEAEEFRKHFFDNPKRNDSFGKNHEHRLESLLLTEFSKKDRKDKKICNIQPVKLAGIARFQMPTPLSGCKIKNIKYSGARGGGIDIISRTGKGAATKLCIMEVKDENKSKEPPAKVIQQGLAYATFIRGLLKSKNSGDEWWKIFGFNGKCPDKLELNVACVMPLATNNDTSFAGKIIKIDQDSFHLHYIYFQEKDNEIINIESSLK